MGVIEKQICREQITSADGDFIEPPAEIEDGVVQLERGGEGIQRVANVGRAKQKLVTDGLAQRPPPPQWDRGLPC